MDRDSFTTLFIGVTVAILVYVWRRRRRMNLPPGPIGLPILGYLPFLGKDSYQLLHELTQKYGPVFSFYLGRKLVVVLGSFDTVKEAYTKREVLDRPPHPPNHLLPQSTSMAIANGRAWKEQRQFSIQLLRQLGMGKSRMEQIIQTEITHLVNVIAARDGRATNLDAILLPSVSNNIYTLLSGQRLDIESEDRQFLNQVMKTMTMYFRPTIAHAYFPSIKWWMSKLRIWGYDQVERIMRKFGKFVEKQMSARLNYLDPQNVKCYLDGFMLKMQNSDGGSTFSKKMLRGNFLSFFGAGSTPATATLEFAFVCMIRYPEVQEKVQRELDSVVGRSHLPEWSDRNDLTYTTSVILEVMRSNSIIPISMLRCASRDTKIGGYDVPKGAIIMTNLWGVHHHPDYWTDPEVFRPERFLKEGKVFKPPYLIPFSFGRRNCPGEDLANMIVFLYFTRLLQKFTVSVPPGESGKFKEKIGIARLIIPDNVCLKRRHDVEPTSLLR